MTGEGERSFSPSARLLPDGWEMVLDAVARAERRVAEAKAAGIGLAEAEEILEAAVVSASIWFEQQEGA